jgi:hypothetical protein
MSSLLDHAIEHNAAGYSIIFTGKDKRAIGGWKRDQLRRASPHELRERFRTHERRVTGIAIVHGPVSNDVYCRDFDVFDSYEKWAASHPDLARTLPTAKSFRAPHVYFKCAEPLTTKKCGDGEVRGFGGYTVLPPSRHPAGITYSWTIPPDDVPYLDPTSAGFFQNWQLADFEPKKAPPSSSSNHCNPVTLRSCNPVTLCDTDLELMVLASLPTEKGQNHAKLFALARRVKAFEKDRSAVVAADDLERVFAAWYDKSSPFLRSGQSRDQYLIEFLEAYQDARGDGLAEAWVRALKSPPPACANHFEDPQLKLLLTLLRELQRSVRDGDPFFLSCYSVETLLGIHNRTAARVLKAFCGLRVLQLIERGAMGRASLYRYLGD